MKLLDSILSHNPRMVPSSDEARKHLVRQRWLFVALTVVAVIMTILAPDPASKGIVGVGMFAFTGMIIDAQCLLADAVALAATGIATNVYDSGAAGNDVFVGEPLGIVITVDVAADFTTGDETYTFNVDASAAANLGTPTTLVSRAIPATKLTAGSIHVIPIPPMVKILRYVGLNVVLAGTTPTITYTAFIQPMSMIQANKLYADNITIS